MQAILVKRGLNHSLSENFSGNVLDIKQNCFKRLVNVSRFSVETGLFWIQNTTNSARHTRSKVFSIMVSEPSSSSVSCDRHSSDEGISQRLNHLLFKLLVLTEGVPKSREKM